MIVLIGLIVGMLIVITVITVGIIALHAWPQSQKPVERGDGQYRARPVSDTYYRDPGNPPSDNTGGYWSHM